MNMSQITNGRMVELPIDAIEIASDRLRQASPDKVADLSLSISELGLLSPILVREADGKGHHQLIGGLHRLQACRGLGWASIPAVVLDIKGVQARLAEVDENLVRNDLSPLEWAVHFAERKAIYEALHPETRHGGDRKSVQAANVATWVDRFSASAARRFGTSERSIQRAVQRYSRIDPDVRHRIADTPLARKGADLDALARLEPAQQKVVVDLLLSGTESERPKSVAAAVAALSDRDGTRREAPKPAADLQYEALLKAWKAAGSAARERFAAYLQQSGARAAGED